jgi:quercetin dioxygenase-like cupin family protein
MKFSELSKLAATTVRHNATIHKKMMLQPGDAAPIVQFSQATFPPGEKVAAHCHDSMHEVFFVQQGEVEFTINGVVQHATEGGCVLAAAGEVHALQNVGEGELKLLFFGVETRHE